MRNKRGHLYNLDILCSWKNLPGEISPISPSALIGKNFYPWIFLIWTLVIAQRIAYRAFQCYTQKSMRKSAFLRVILKHWKGSRMRLIYITVDASSTRKIWRWMYNSVVYQTPDVTSCTACSGETSAAWSPCTLDSIASISRLQASPKTIVGKDKPVNLLI